jgi:hypothetical protein
MRVHISVEITAVINNIIKNGTKNILPQNSVHVQDYFAFAD